MKFNEYLKAKRKEKGLTQEQLAEKIGVSTDTIQNWERGKNPPSREFWPKLAEALGVTTEEIGKQIAASERTNEELLKEERSARENFPDFLFPESEVEKIKNLVLTEEEQELLGLEEVYGGYIDGTCSRAVVAKIGTTSGLPLLPYEYINRKGQLGSFYVLNLHKSLVNKLNNYRDFVVEQSVQKPGKIFNIFNCTPIQMFNICECIERRTYEEGSYTEKVTKTTTRKDTLKRVIELLQEIEKENASLTLAKDSKERTRDNEIKWLITSNYVKALLNNVCFDNYGRYANRQLETGDTYAFKGNLKSTYPQYITVKEIYPPDEVYEKAKAEYAEKMHAFADNGCEGEQPVPPEKHVMIIEATMTKQGKQLLQWYNENFKNTKYKDLNTNNITCNRKACTNNCWCGDDYDDDDDWDWDWDD